MEIRRATVLRFTLVLAGLAFCAFGLWLLLGPAQYQATVEIKIDPRGISAYDPHFIQAEFEVIQSQIVLSKVVKALNLNVEWGKCCTGGRQLKTDEVVNQLRRRMSSRLVRNTMLEINVTSENPDEAAKIANAIPKAYREFRLEQRRQSMVRAVQVLTEQYQNEEEQIYMVQTNVESLRVECKITNDVPPPEILREQTNRSESHNFLSGQPYWDEKNKLDRMIEFHKLLKEKIESVQSDSTDSSPWLPPSMVEIIETAIPPKSPVGPDRLLGVLLFGIGLFPSVSGFLLLKSSSQQPVWPTAT